MSSREEARKDFGGRRVEFRGRKGGEGRVEKKRGESNRMNGTLENMTVPGGVKGIEEEEEKEMETSWRGGEKREEGVDSLRREMSGKYKKEVFTGSKVPPAWVTIPGVLQKSALLNVQRADLH